MKEYKFNLLSNWLLLFPIYLISMTTIFTFGSSHPVWLGDAGPRILTPTLETRSSQDGQAQVPVGYRVMHLLPVNGFGPALESDGTQAATPMVDPATILLISAGAIGLAGIGRRRRSSQEDNLACECSK